MKYKKICNTPREPHFLNVLFPTILPFDWLRVVWFLLTFRARKVVPSIRGIFMLMRLNKMAKDCLGNDYVADFYSISSMSRAELNSEIFRFSALLNEAEKMEKDRAVINK